MHQSRGLGSGSDHVERLLILQLCEACAPQLAVLGVNGRITASGIAGSRRSTQRQGSFPLSGFCALLPLPEGSLRGQERPACKLVHGLQAWPRPPSCEGRGIWDGPLIDSATRTWGGAPWDAGNTNCTKFWRCEGDFLL